MNLIYSGWLLLCSAASASASDIPISAQSFQQWKDCDSRAFDPWIPARVFNSLLFQPRADDQAYRFEAMIPDSLQSLMLQAEGPEKQYYEMVLGLDPITHEKEIIKMIIENIVDAPVAFLPKTEMLVVHMAAEHAKNLLRSRKVLDAKNLIGAIWRFYICRRNMREHVLDLLNEIDDAIPRFLVGPIDKMLWADHVIMSLQGWMPDDEVVRALLETSTMSAETLMDLLKVRGWNELVRSTSQFASQFEAYAVDPGNHCAIDANILKRNADILSKMQISGANSEQASVSELYYQVLNELRFSPNPSMALLTELLESASFRGFIQTNAAAAMEKCKILIQAAASSGRPSLSKSVYCQLIEGIPFDLRTDLSQLFLIDSDILFFRTSFEYIARQKELDPVFQVFASELEGPGWSPQSIVKLCIDSDYPLEDQTMILKDKDLPKMLVFFEETVPYDYDQFINNSFVKVLLVSSLEFAPSYILSKYWQLLFSEKWLQYVVEKATGLVQLSYVLKFACASDELYEELVRRKAVILAPFKIVACLPVHFIERGLILTGFEPGDMKVTSIDRRLALKYNGQLKKLLECESSDAIYTAIEAKSSVDREGLVPVLIMVLNDAEVLLNFYSGSENYANMFAFWYRKNEKSFRRYVHPRMARLFCYIPERTYRTYIYLETVWLLLVVIFSTLTDYILHSVGLSRLPFTPPQIPPHA